MSDRKNGWYWVRDDGFWVCAEYVGGSWFGAGIEGGADEWFEEIGPRIPSPDEPWQTVPNEPTEAMLCAAEIAAANKETDMLSPAPIEHPDDGGGSAGYYYRALLAAAPKP